MTTTHDEARRRVEKLRREITRYREAYHTHDTSLISDEALDSLKRELFDLELRFPDLVTPDSPTQRVAGAPLESFEKAVHEEPMRSLHDVFSAEELSAWFRRLASHLKREVTPVFYVEPKLDGFAIELVYEDGIFVQGSTRGDGLVGENVTQNLKTIEDIPLTLRGAYPPRLVVRGEVLVTRREFARMNAEQEERGEKRYANPRNLAAGSVRQLDSRVTASRRLASFQYEVVSDLGQTTHEEEHRLLASWGFTVNPQTRRADSLDAVLAYCADLEKRRAGLPYEIDGAVVIVNDSRLFDEAGSVGKAPRAACAYKFSPSEATTVVEEVRVQVGRTGVLTPVAVLRPVSVHGVTITHATLHNADQIERLDLRIGDTVIVSRAGDVIPQVTRVLSELRTGEERAFSMPAACPIDGSPVVRDGVAYRCANPSCGARHLEGLRHFVSRGAFNIEGLGPKILERFTEEGLISDAADIFTLRAGDIAVVERFGEKSAENIVREVFEKRRVSLPRFLYALGIPQVGEETARILAREAAARSAAASREMPPSVIGEILRAATDEELRALPDVGPKVAANIMAWFLDERHSRLLTRLDEAGVRVALDDRGGFAPGPLAGRSFVLTGTLRGMTREEAKERIRAQGGEVHEAVSAKTSYLVAGEKPGSKHERASALGVTILDEEAFRRLVA